MVGDAPTAVRARHVPVRRCAGCRQPDTVAELVRLVVAPDPATGEVVLVLDPRRRLPGRGVNVHARASCLDRAFAPRALARNLRVDPAPSTVAVRTRLAAGSW